jgi:2-alkyl-3-oxoalkanoate reductase
MEKQRNKKTPENVLVTGGGGFLGKAVVKLLVKRGDIVSSFSRREHAGLKEFGVKQIQGDISDKEAVLRACKGMDLVFHIAAKPGVWGNYNNYYSTNVSGTLNVIAGCKIHGVQRLVYTSSPSVVFDGRDMEGADESAPYPRRFYSHYSQTKAIAEQSVVKASGRRLNTIILRPHLIWGPGDNHLVPRIIARADKLRIIGNGKNLTDNVYIDNAADAHILAADCLKYNEKLSARIYFITQDEPVPLWDMVNSILGAAGIPPITGSINRKIAWIIGAALECVHKGLNIKKEPRVTRFVAQELATSHWFDISAAKKDLNYVPKVSIKQGLELLEQWLKNSDKTY